MAYDVSQLLNKPMAELDKLFSAGQPGPIPNGQAQGTAIPDPGSKLSPEYAKLVEEFVWQGKVFDAEHKTLINRLGVLGTHGIVAQVYVGKSLIDGKDCIVLDYSKTSLVAKHIRDEIRLIAPNTYLGPVFWDQKKLCYFALQF